MAKAIGISTLIKDALNMIDDGISPVLTHHNSTYVLETVGRDTGSLYYTRFDSAMVADYSVQMPFSYAHTVGELLNKGDNLRARIPPRINELPAIGIGSLYT